MNPTEEDINRNLKNVDEGKDLDISLCALNGEFKKRYFRDKEYIKEYKKAYNQKPEVKARMKVYYKEYYQKMKKENDTNT